MSVDVPSGPLYEGTRQTLNCSVTLTDSVDTEVTVEVEWQFGATTLTSTERVEISDVSGVKSPYSFTLTFSPLIMFDAGQYSCEVTADSVSSYITASMEGINENDIHIVSGMCRKDYVDM